MSRAVRFEAFGGPDVLEVHHVAPPHAGAGEVRVRVAAAGLNPLDWLVSSMPERAAAWDIAPPAGFGCDFAGVVDEVGPGAAGYAVGDRVYGRAMSRAAAEHAVVRTTSSRHDTLLHTPDDISDDVAAALPTPGLTASAALTAVGLGAADTVLVGAAAGGVGVLAVQLATLAGARVIGTCSPGTFAFVRELGAEPVEHGAHLADRVRALAPNGITTAIDLFGTETIDAALTLGVSPERIAAIAVGPRPPHGVRGSTVFDGQHADLVRITDAIRAGTITVPIAARLPLERVRDAVTLQAGRHAHGKILLQP